MPRLSLTEINARGMTLPVDSASGLIRRTRSGTGCPARAAASTTAGSSRCSTLQHRGPPASPGCRRAGRGTRPAPGSCRGRTPRPPGGPWRPIRAPRGQHRLVHPAAVHPRAAEFGEQGRVDVDDPPMYFGDDGGRDQLAGSPPGRRSSTRASSRCAEPLSAVAVVGQDPGRDAVCPGPLQSARTQRVAQDQHHLRRGARAEGPDQGLQVAAPARDTNRHPHRHGATK